MQKREPTDSRAERKRFDRNLLILVVLTFIFFGGLMVTLVYGVSGLLGALPCLLGGVFIMLLLWGFFTLSERLTDRFDV